MSQVSGDARTAVRPGFSTDDSPVGAGVETTLLSAEAGFPNAPQLRKEGSFQESDGEAEPLFESPLPISHRAFRNKNSPLRTGKSSIISDDRATVSSRSSISAGVRISRRRKRKKLSEHRHAHPTGQYQEYTIDQKEFEYKTLSELQRDFLARLSTTTTNLLSLASANKRAINSEDDRTADNTRRKMEERDRKEHNNNKNDVCLDWSNNSSNVSGDTLRRLFPILNWLNPCASAKNARDGGVILDEQHQNNNDDDEDEDMVDEFGNSLSAQAHYTWDHFFRGDLVAGMTVVILLIPQSMAYAKLAGLPEIYGLYCSIVPLLIYSLMGTSTQISPGPVAPTALLIASATAKVLTEVHSSDDDNSTHQNGGIPEMQSDEWVSAALTMSFLSGICLLILGLLKFGNIVVLLSRPVMTGYIMAAALIILAKQIKQLLKLQMGRTDLFYRIIIKVCLNIKTADWKTSLLSLSSLFVLLWPKISPDWPIKIPRWFPLPLLIMIVITSLSYFLNFEDKGISVLGKVDRGFPMPNVIDLKYITVRSLLSAFLVAVVSYLGSIALVTSFANKAQDRYRSELEKYNEAMEAGWENAGDTPQLSPKLSPLQMFNTKKNLNNNKHHSNKDGSTAQSRSSSPLRTGQSSNNSSSEEDDEFGDGGRVAVEKDDDPKNDNFKELPKPLVPLALKPDPNQEFIAFGVACMVGALFSSFTTSASFSRTALNFDMGAQSQVSSILCAVTCLIFVTLLTGLLGPLPDCVLAAVVAASVYRLIMNGLSEAKFLWVVSRAELAEFVSAFVFPLLFGLEMGLTIGVFCSIAVKLYLSSTSEVAMLGQLNGSKTKYANLERFADTHAVKGVCIIELRAEVSFLNYNLLCERILKEYRENNITHFVLSLGLTTRVDTTALRELGTIFNEHPQCFFALVQVRVHVRSMIRRISNNIRTSNNRSAFPLNTNVRMFLTINDGVSYCRALLRKSGQASFFSGSMHHSSVNDHSYMKRRKGGSMRTMMSPIPVGTDRSSTMVLSGNDTMTDDFTDVDIEQGLFLRRSDLNLMSPPLNQSVTQERNSCMNNGKESSVSSQSNDGDPNHHHLRRRNNKNDEVQMAVKNDDKGRPLLTVLRTMSDDGGNSTANEDAYIMHNSTDPEREYTQKSNLVIHSVTDEESNPNDNHRMLGEDDHHSDDVFAEDEEIVALAAPAPREIVPSRLPTNYDDPDFESTA